MTRARDPAFWASLVLLALVAGAISIGWPLLRLGFAEANEGPGSASLRKYVDGSPAGEMAALDVARADEAPEPKQREADLVALLKSAPSTSGAWLDLAIARRAAGGNTEDVVAALALSAMTGPNEALLMAGRVGFALPFWSALPPDARRSLVADLVGGWASIDGAERERLSAILQNAPDGSSEAVRAALLTAGGDGPAIAAALLPAPKPSPATTAAPGAAASPAASAAATPEPDR